MTSVSENRGGAPVGFITELDSIEAAAVVYLRLWSDGPTAQSGMRADFVSLLGPSRGARAIETFETLIDHCARHGRRPLMRHALTCKCLGADEACFANFIGAAADCAHEDAMIFAALLVRPDMAALVADLATDFGLCLKQMRLRAPRELGHHPHSSTLH
mgnify:CR=1 FL=1|tara:strand:- start:65678 stop:66154 length:477 start_codon:yes stop_codon:yes gene_type:complete